MLPVQSNNKRTYVSRKFEFADMPVETVQAKIKETAKAVSDIDSKLLGTCTEAERETLTKEKKELINYRIRAYSRLRALNVDSKKIRSEKAAQKKALVTKAEDKDQVA